MSKIILISILSTITLLSRIFKAKHILKCIYTERKKKRRKEGREVRKEEEKIKINPKPLGSASQPSTMLLKSEPGAKFWLLPFLHPLYQSHAKKSLPLLAIMH